MDDLWQDIVALRASVPWIGLPCARRPFRDRLTSSARAALKQQRQASSQRDRKRSYATALELIDWTAGRIATDFGQPGGFAVGAGWSRLQAWAVVEHGRCIHSCRQSVERDMDGSTHTGLTKRHSFMARFQSFSMQIFVTVATKGSVAVLRVRVHVRCVGSKPA